MSKIRIHLKVNGEERECLAPVHHTLLEVLREELGLMGTKHGCELGECGTCTVLIEGKPVLSCLALPVECDGREITTVTSAQDRARMSGDQLVAMEKRRSAAIRGGLATIGKGAAAVGALAVATSGAADKIGLTNTASLALAGTWGGTAGIAVGAAAGLTLDLAHANDDLRASITAAKAAIIPASGESGG